MQENRRWEKSQFVFFLERVEKRSGNETLSVLSKVRRCKVGFLFFFGFPLSSQAEFVPVDDEKPKEKSENSYVFLQCFHEDVMTTVQQPKQGAGLVDVVGGDEATPVAIASSAWRSALSRFACKKHSHALEIASLDKDQRKPFAAMTIHDVRKATKACNRKGYLILYFPISH